MLLDQFARFFLRHELVCRPCRGHGIPLPLRSGDGTVDVEDLLQTAITKKKATLPLRNGDVVRLAKLDVRTKEQVAVFLFRRTDANAAAPFFEHQRTGVLRRSDKQRDESLTVSAHLVVHLKSFAGSGNPRHPAILEEVPGLGRTYIQGLLAGIIKEEKYDYTDKHGDTAETYTLARLEGVKSQTIDAAMRHKNAIPYVVLVRPANVTGLDTEGMAVPQDERMKLMLRATPEKTVGVLNKIKGWAGQNDWDDVRVQLDLPNDRSRFISIAREADAADVLFVRSERVVFDKALDPATEIINEELVEKARKLFAPSKWKAEE